MGSKMKRVVMFSGGVGSWAAGKRVADKHSTDGLYLLFTDTLIEDDDTYRFLREGAANIGGELVWLKDGRNPFELFHDVRLLGNSQAAPCSHKLKQDVARKWIKDHCDPEDTTIYVGIDWMEQHRLAGAQRGWEPYRVEAPMCEPPLLSKAQMIDWARSEGLEKQRLYRLGFAHANCGGGCVRAGHGHWALLLNQIPERYAWWESEEQKIRDYLGKDVSILKDRRGGETTPMTLRTFRERIQSGCNVDMFDLGGCGCFLDDDRIDTTFLPKE